MDKKLLTEKLTSLIKLRNGISTYGMSLQDKIAIESIDIEATPNNIPNYLFTNLKSDLFVTETLSTLNSVIKDLSTEKATIEFSELITAMTLINRVFYTNEDSSLCPDELVEIINGKQKGFVSQYIEDNKIDICDVNEFHLIFDEANLLGEFTTTTTDSISFNIETDLKSFAQSNQVLGYVLHNHYDEKGINPDFILKCDIACYLVQNPSLIQCLFTHNYNSILTEKAKDYQVFVLSFASRFIQFINQEAVKDGVLDREAISRFVEVVREEIQDCVVFNTTSQIDNQHFKKAFDVIVDTKLNCISVILDTFKLPEAFIPSDEFKTVLNTIVPEDMDSISQLHDILWEFPYLYRGAVLCFGFLPK